MSISMEQFVLVGGIILVALVLLMAGIVAALRARNPNPATNQAVSSDKPAPVWLKGLAGTAGKTIAGAPGATGVPADALVVMRDPVSGGWIVEINGMRYTNLKDVHDDRAASKVLEALAGLQEFAGVRPPAGSPPLGSPTASRPSPQPASQALSANVEPAVAKALQGGSPTSQPTHPAPPNSMLDQIEKVLQRNLLKHPELGNRKIHVGAARDGSLLIEIEQGFYQAVGDVPEPAVRDIIQASILEWERTA